MFMIEFSKTTRSYATREAAVKAAEKLFPKGMDPYGNSVRCVIASQYGRFSPVFFLDANAQRVGLFIANSGFHVVG